MHASVLCTKETKQTGETQCSCETVTFHPLAASGALKALASLTVMFAQLAHQLEEWRPNTTRQKHCHHAFGSGEDRPRLAL